MAVRCRPHPSFSEMAVGGSNPNGTDAGSGGDIGGWLLELSSELILP